VAGCSENSTKFAGSKKGKEFLGKLRDHQLSQEVQYSMEYLFKDYHMQILSYSLF
jgi:hypothetical protein